MSEIQDFLDRTEQGGCAVVDRPPGQELYPGRDRSGMAFIPAGGRTGTRINPKSWLGPGSGSSRPGPGFFQIFFSKNENFFNNFSRF